MDGSVGTYRKSKSWEVYYGGGLHGMLLLSLVFMNLRNTFNMKIGTVLVFLIWICRLGIIYKGSVLEVYIMAWILCQTFRMMYSIDRPCLISPMCDCVEWEAVYIVIIVCALLLLLALVHWCILVHALLLVSLLALERRILTWLFLTWTTTLLLLLKSLVALQ